ncbi:MAG: DUF1801 domain-containing protein [Flavobacteriaceae bacterium]|nr:DUF1801 domain-containing protein [Flavobacteriaceae bacterium]
MNPSEEYILNQPEPYRTVLLHLQVIIETTLPEVELLYKYKIPFYYIHKKPFCYLNASHKKQFVDLGFWKGNQIDIHQNHLVTENRKMMASLRYKSLNKINDKILIEVLKRAASFY